MSRYHSKRSHRARRKGGHSFLLIMVVMNLAIIITLAYFLTGSNKQPSFEFEDSQVIAVADHTVDVSATAEDRSDESNDQEVAGQTDSVFDSENNIKDADPLGAQGRMMGDGESMMQMMSDDLPLVNIHNNPIVPTARKISFEHHIRPILEIKCVNCHGEERQKGDLRLDTREAVLKGGDQGPAMVPGDASGSLIYEVTMLDESDDEHMPAKGEPLSAREKDMLRKWLDQGAKWTPGLKLKARTVEKTILKVPEPSRRRELINNKRLQLAHSRQIDDIIDAYLVGEGVVPAGPAPDEVFLRRAYLDIAGRIPTLKEYESFMASQGEGKRHQLVDELVESPAYVSHTLNQWLETLRVKFHNLKKQTPTYMMWIRNAIKDNMPYDEFVKRQLQDQGSIYNPDSAAGFFVRDANMPQDRVSAVMQTFLGTSMACAQCHDHPLAEWTQMDFYKIMAFFNGVRLTNGGSYEVFNADLKLASARGMKLKNKSEARQRYKWLGDRLIRGGTGKARLPGDYKYDDGKPGQLIKADVPFGQKVRIDYSKTSGKTPEDYEFISDGARKKLRMYYKLPDVNSREAFAQWATSPENPMFTKTIVNRLWSRAFGVPLVGDLGDISTHDMGKSPQLTTYLEQLMKNIAYDQKLFMKIIYKTRAYQRVAFPQPGPGEMPFGAPVITRLSAEQLWDSLVTLRRENPDEGVADGSLEDRGANYKLLVDLDGLQRLRAAMDESFPPAIARELKQKTFVRNFSLEKRASLMPRSEMNSFMGMFGRSQREVMEDSVKEPNIPQVLYMMNGEMVDTLIPRAKSKIARKAAKLKVVRSEIITRVSAAGFNRKSISWIYHAVLSREPSEREIRMVESGLRRSPDPIRDLLWSIVNTNEFKMKL